MQLKNLNSKSWFEEILVSEKYVKKESRTHQPMH